MNDKKATEPTDEQVTFYKGSDLAGPSYCAAKN